ncbi:TonB-dependent receptor [Stakelama sediminis]|uniref:Iron complex outermembrane receptor protein n=1 Tax=Stakelama sediminis TaxID=463200 RepID=A0A840Z1S2_9SPHN|nr:TonB-dependent receptor [Stakelama sediminis]MBB5719843.1 iron complex outermembrane receptor protein [Stakelama sediminis]
MVRLNLYARPYLMASAAILAISALPAYAQSTDTNSKSTTQTGAERQAQQQADVAASVDQGDNEIIVTARRRAETLLDVPIAVTAYTGAALQQAGALDVTDLSETTPNVTLEVSRGTNSTLTAFIRGVGQQDPVAGFEPGVGVYLDDVYLNRPQAAVLDIYDVERIEVLRGPQGTLYGRNTIGGAVKYVTKRLGDTPTLNIRGTYGSYNQADLVVSAGTPIGDGTFKIGGAVARLSRDGFGKNLTTGQQNYNKDIWAARGTLEFEPSSALFMRVSGDYTHDMSNPRGGHRLITSLASGIPPLSDVYDSRGGLNDPHQDVKAWGVTWLTEAHPADWLTFRSIMAYRKDDSATPIDFDALPAVDLDVPAYYNNKQFSQEVQLLVDTGKLNGLVGLYYLDASARTVFDVRLPATVTALTFGQVDTDTVAIFGDFTYDFTPKFSLSLGGRYTWDNRTSDINRGVYIGGGSPYFGGGGTLILTQSNFRGTRGFKEFTPRASFSFKPTPDQNFYISYAKGFKGGGFDPRGVSTAAPDTNGDGTVSYNEVYNFMTFDPETVDSYEVGYKAALFDRRLRFALDGFIADYRDVQVPGSVGTVINGQQTFIGVTTNAGKAKIKGVEFEGNLIAARDMGTVGDQLNIAWSVGYIDAKYKQFIDSRGIDVASERAFQNTPAWTASGTLGYSTPVGAGSVDASATVSYRSSTQQFELRTPMLDQAAYALLNANIVWHINDRYSIGVHGRNLTDKRYIVSGYNFLAQDPDTGNFLRNASGNYIPTLGAEGVLTAYYGNPRQVFVTFGAKF